MPTKAQLAEAEWLSVLAEPTRLALIRILAAGDRTVNDLARGIGFKSVYVSFHLKKLKRAGLVTVEREGTFHRYTLVGGRVTGKRLELTHPSGTTVTLSLA